MSFNSPSMRATAPHTHTHTQRHSELFFFTDLLALHPQPTHDDPLTTVIEQLCGVKVVLIPSVGQQLVRYIPNFLSEMQKC